MSVRTITSLLALATPIAAQQIYDVVRAMFFVRACLRSDFHLQYSTQWDRSTLFTYTDLGPYGELNFTSSEPSNSVTISVDDSTVYQQKPRSS